MNGVPDRRIGLYPAAPNPYINASSTVLSDTISFRASSIIFCVIWIFCFAM